MSIKVVCVDDHYLFLQGLQNILQSNQEFEVTGVYNHPKKFLSALNNMNTDIVTLDVNMPEINGLEICKRIKLWNDKIKVLFITMFETNNVSAQIKSAGGNGFISKNVESCELFAVLKKVYNNEEFFPAALSHFQIINSIEPSVLLLTKREKEIILMIKEGKTSKAIAEQLYLSEYTIETHRKNIFKKLNLRSVQELVGFVYENFKLF